MAIKVASAPINWGIMEHVELPADYPYNRVLDEIKAAGYSGTELGPYGFLPADSAVLRNELAKRSLTLCSAFVDIELGNEAAHAAGLDFVSRSAKLISEAGARLLVLSDKITPARNATSGRRSDANEISWSEAEWQAAAAAIREVIKLCKAVGEGEAATALADVVTHDAMQVGADAIGAAGRRAVDRAAGGGRG